jgi:protein TonB
VAEAPIVPLEALLNSNTRAERRMLEAILSEDPVASLDPPAKVLVDPPLQLTRVTDEDANYGDSSPEFRQRRVHQRSQIRPFSYIELGRDNGGMLLDISEGGFAVATAECVTGDGFPSIKIQFTGSMDRIEASGQIAWISESKRKAGIRFVKLTEEARRTIASRISREESPGEFHGQSSNVPVNPVVHVEFPKDAVLGDASSEIVVQEHLRPSAPPRLAMPGVPRGNIQPTVAAPDALPLKLWNRSEFKPKPRPAIRPVTPKERTERLRRIAAAIILVVATGATVGWIEVSPVVRNTVKVFNAQNTKSANEPAQVQKSRPAATSTNASAPRSENTGSQAPEFGLVPADHSVNRAETRRVLERPQMANKERSAAPPAFNGAVGRHVSPPPKNPSVSPSQHAVVPATNPAPDSAGRQAVENSSTQPAGSTAIPATSAPMSLHVDPASTVIKEKESSPSPVKQPEVPVSVTWSVAVSGDPYPSIRIPPDISSQKASRGRSLQIGRATSHAEPVYPEEAKRQGVEGTVKLHVVVGRDGAVQSVEPMSGPALLTKAATSAVREWRYSQTLLGGQPVETEQDIVVKFRLESASISKN